MRVAHRVRYLFFALIPVFALAASPGIRAAPGCVDADGDDIAKNHPKWCPNGWDPDDNDPCNPNREATACSGGGGGGDTGPDPYNLARASFATRDELGNPIGGGVFADEVDACGPYDYWDWQEALLPADVGLACPQYLNSSNVSGGGRWFLISSAAGSEEVVDEIERWLVVDFSSSTDGAPCYDLDNGGTAEDYSDLGIPLYLDYPIDQIAENADPCVDNLSVRLAADRILKAKANQQQLEFSIRHRPDPEASIYWSPWGYVSYIKPLYLREPSVDDPSDWIGCRVMSTRSAPGAPHDRAEAELLLSTGAGTTELLGSYNLPLEVCVKRASE